jgi:adenylyltransferase/sulfurtransferase
MWLDLLDRFPVTRRRRPKRFRSKPVAPHLQRALSERQDGVSPTVDFQNVHALLIGAGGLCSPIAIAAMRQGIGRLTILDDDIIEWSNLTRQHYDRRDVGRHKVHALGQSLAATGMFPLIIDAYPWRFQEYVERLARPPHFDLAIAGVDNNPSRRAASIYGLTRGIPVVHAAISRDANSLYVFVQQPGSACWGCAHPEYVDDAVYPCAVPQILDILNVASGFVMYAANSLVSPAARPREWNSVQVWLDGGLPPLLRTIPRRADCPICTPPPLPSHGGYIAPAKELAS